MSYIIAIGNGVAFLIQSFMERLDRRLKGYIKIYSDSAIRRYPNMLNPLERIFAPLVVRGFAGSVANLITIVRLLTAIGIFIYLEIVLTPPASPFQLLVALVIFIAAGLLDFLDGAVARLFNQITVFGQMCDPLADKLLLASVFIPLGYVYLPGEIFWSVIALESFLVVIAVTKQGIKSLPFTMATQANRAGKFKNAGELIGGGLLFLCPLGSAFLLASELLFILSIPLAVGSIIGYLTSIRRISKLS